MRNWQVYMSKIGDYVIEKAESVYEGDTEKVVEEAMLNNVKEK